ncbi:MAG: hypothetical protein DRI01_05485, partial [Chloroflexi bacterium]
MSAIWREHGRGAVVVLAVALGVLSLTAVFVVAAYDPLDVKLRSQNLSYTRTLISARPDLAFSPDGNWVAVVWTEGHSEVAGFVGHVYLRGAREMDDAWQQKVQVFSGSSSAYAYDTAVAVMGGVAHLVYAVFEFEGGQRARTGVRYRTCALPDGPCGAEESVFTDPTYLITQVDIALDGDGDPHVIWARFNEPGDVGDVLYSTRGAGGWESETWLDESWVMVDSMPAIAWEGGYVHAVWESERDLGDNQKESYIYYRRREDQTDVWDSAIPVVPRQTRYPPGNPDVAGGAGRVFVVWDWCTTKDLNDEYCEKYNLVYSRAEVTGTVFFSDWKEVGTDKLTMWQEYYSTDSVESGYLSVEDEYLLDLQPAVTLSRHGWPAVAWHANRSHQGTLSKDYAVYYTYAITGTETSVDWITPTIVSGDQLAKQGSATIGVGEPMTDSQILDHRLHVAYMRQQSAGGWDVYDSSEWPI